MFHTRFRLPRIPLRLVLLCSVLVVVTYVVRFPPQVSASETPAAPAIHGAAESGNVDAVRRLIQSGVDVNSRNDEGETALHVAILNGKFDVATLLLSSSADPNARTKAGRTPLMYLAVAGRYVARMAPFSSTASGGYEPFEGQVAFTSALLKKGAKPDLGDSSTSALLFALNIGYSEIARTLITAGARVNVVGKQGVTPLLCATLIDDSVTVRMLLARGAPVDVPGGPRRQTALQYAAGNGCLPIVKLLIGAGANPSYRDADGKTALDLTSKMAVKTYLRAHMRPRKR